MYTICSLYDAHSKTIPGHFKFGHFQDGRQKNKMAETSNEDVCSKLIISQFLFINNNKLGIKLKLK